MCVCVFVFQSIVSFTFSSKLERVTGNSVFVLRLWLFTVEPRWIFFVLASSHLAVDLTLDVPLDSFLFILTLPRILAHRFSELVHNHRFCPDLMLVRVYRSPQQRLAHVHRVAVAVELC